MNVKPKWTYKKVEYYFDKISINCEIRPEHLRELIDTSAIRPHCKNILIWEASNTAKYHGYQSRIDIFDATYQCMELVKGYDLATHGITHIEIKKHITFSSSKEAEEYRIYQRDHLHKKWGRGNFAFRHSLYRGKTKGKPSRMYIRTYPSQNDNCVIHTEFTIILWPNVKKKLGINSLYDLPSAKDVYDDLESRYLQHKKPNKTRLQKLMKLNPAPYSVMPETIDDVRNWLTDQKGYEQDRFYMNRALNKSKRLRKRLCAYTKRKLERRYTKGKKYFGQINDRYPGYFLTEIDNTEVKTM